MDKKVVILAVVITMIFSSYILINTNNINKTNNIIYSPDGGYFHMQGNYYITGINLVNHYILLDASFSQNGVIIGQGLNAYTDNNTFASKYLSAGIDVYTTPNNIIIPFDFQYLSSANDNNNSLMLTNTFIVYNNSVPFNVNSYNANSSDIYYEPTFTSFSYNITDSSLSTFSQNINYYNNIALKTVGYAEFESLTTFNLTINNNKYINVNNFNITLPIGTYSYSIQHNNTFINGSIVINNIAKQVILVNFQHIVIASNYLFIVFILATASIALLLAYYLNRNFYTFFTLELFFLFIGYQANIPFITITIFVFILFFMVLLLVYKMVLE